MIYKKYQYVFSCVILCLVIFLDTSKSQTADTINNIGAFNIGVATGEGVGFVGFKISQGISQHWMLTSGFGYFHYNPESGIHREEWSFLLTARYFLFSNMYVTTGMSYKIKHLQIDDYPKQANEVVRPIGIPLGFGFEFEGNRSLLCIEMGYAQYFGRGRNNIYVRLAGDNQIRSEILPGSTGLWFGASLYYCSREKPYKFQTIEELLKSSEDKNKFSIGVVTGGDIGLIGINASYKLLPQWWVSVGEGYISASSDNYHREEWTINAHCRYYPLSFFYISSGISYKIKEGIIESGLFEAHQYIRSVGIPVSAGIEIGAQAPLSVILNWGYSHYFGNAGRDVEISLPGNAIQVLSSSTG